jgi:hypothetical protein
MDLNQHDEWDERLADGDLLVGRNPIRDFLVRLGMPPSTDPYYLKRSGWPIGNTGGGASGGKLIATKNGLARHAENIARGRARADHHNLIAE